VTAALVVEELNVWYDTERGSAHVVRDVSFELAAGQRLGLVGESGCGKTTTLFALMGLLPPTATLSGSVRLLGEELLGRGGEASVRPHRWKDVAIVFQGASGALNPVKSVGAQIAEPLRVHRGASRKAALARAGELLELVEIPRRHVSSYPHELSGGMRQRACIAMALACEPRVLLADEPTTALDVMVQAQVMQLLTDLTSELGIALALVTHDLPLVGRYCDRLAVMYGGEIVEHGAPSAVFAAPEHPYTRMLLAATPELDPDGELPAPIPGTPLALDAEVAGCPFRPRCDSAVDGCATEHPRLRPVAHGGGAACLLCEPGALAVPAEVPEREACR
jgi:oligopeptide/dipeptide ABC transporter ATP-binding protein